MRRCASSSSSSAAIAASYVDSSLACLHPKYVNSISNTTTTTTHQCQQQQMRFKSFYTSYKPSVQVQQTKGEPVLSRSQQHQRPPSRGGVGVSRGTFQTLQQQQLQAPSAPAAASVAREQQKRLAQIREASAVKKPYQPTPATTTPSSTRAASAPPASGSSRLGLSPMELYTPKRPYGRFSAPSDNTKMTSDKKSASSPPPARSVVAGGNGGESRSLSASQQRRKEHHRSIEAMAAAKMKAAQQEEQRDPTDSTGPLPPLHNEDTIFISFSVPSSSSCKTEGTVKVGIQASALLAPNNRLASSPSSSDQPPWFLETTVEIPLEKDDDDAATKHNIPSNQIGNAAVGSIADFHVLSSASNQSDRPSSVAQRLLSASAASLSSQTEKRQSEMISEAVRRGILKPFFDQFPCVRLVTLCPFIGSTVVDIQRVFDVNHIGEQHRQKHLYHQQQQQKGDGHSKHANASSSSSFRLPFFLSNQVMLQEWFATQSQLVVDSNKDDATTPLVHLSSFPADAPRKAPISKFLLLRNNAQQEHNKNTNATNEPDNGRLHHGPPPFLLHIAPWVFGELLGSFSPTLNRLMPPSLHDDAAALTRSFPSETSLLIRDIRAAVSMATILAGQQRNPMAALYLCKIIRNVGQKKGTQPSRPSEASSSFSSAFTQKFFFAVGLRALKGLETMHDEVRRRRIISIAIANQNATPAATNSGAPFATTSSSSTSSQQREKEEKEKKLLHIQQRVEAIEKREAEEAAAKAKKKEMEEKDAQTKAAAATLLQEKLQAALSAAAAHDQQQQAIKKNHNDKMNASSAAAAAAATAASQMGVSGTTYEYLASIYGGDGKSAARNSNLAVSFALRDRLLPPATTTTTVDPKLKPKKAVNSSFTSSAPVSGSSSPIIIAPLPLLHVSASSSSFGFEMLSTAEDTLTAGGYPLEAMEAVKAHMRAFVSSAPMRCNDEKKGAVVKQDAADASQTNLDGKKKAKRTNSSEKKTKKGTPSAIVDDNANKTPASVADLIAPLLYPGMKFNNSGASAASSPSDTAGQHPIPILVAANIKHFIRSLRESVKVKAAMKTLGASTASASDPNSSSLPLVTAADDLLLDGIELFHAFVKAGGVVWCLETAQYYMAGLHVTDHRFALTSSSTEFYLSGDDIVEAMRAKQEASSLSSQSLEAQQKRQKDLNNPNSMIEQRLFRNIATPATIASGKRREREDTTRKATYTLVGKLASQHEDSPWLDGTAQRLLETAASTFDEMNSSGSGSGTTSITNRNVKNNNSMDGKKKGDGGAEQPSSSPSSASLSSVDINRALYVSQLQVAAHTAQLQSILYRSMCLAATEEMEFRGLAVSVLHNSINSTNATSTAVAATLPAPSPIPSPIATKSTSNKDKKDKTEPSSSSTTTAAAAAAASPLLLLPPSVEPLEAVHDRVMRESARYLEMANKGLLQGGYQSVGGGGKGTANVNTTNANTSSRPFLPSSSSTSSAGVAAASSAAPLLTHGLAPAEFLQKQQAIVITSFNLNAPQHVCAALYGGCIPVMAASGATNHGGGMGMGSVGGFTAWNAASKSPITTPASLHPSSPSVSSSLSSAATPKPPLLLPQAPLYNIESIVKLVAHSHLGGRSLSSSSSSSKQSHAPPLSKEAMRAKFAPYIRQFSMQTLHDRLGGGKGNGSIAALTAGGNAAAENAVVAEIFFEKFIWTPYQKTVAAMSKAAAHAATVATTTNESGNSGTEDDIKNAEKKKKNANSSSTTETTASTLSSPIMTVIRISAALSIGPKTPGFISSLRITRNDEITTKDDGNDDDHKNKKQMNADEVFMKANVASRIAPPVILYATNVCCEGLAVSGEKPLASVLEEIQTLPTTATNNGKPTAAQPFLKKETIKALLKSSATTPARARNNIVILSVDGDTKTEMALHQSGILEAIQQRCALEWNLHHTQFVVKSNASSSAAYVPNFLVLTESSLFAGCDNYQTLFDADEVGKTARHQQHNNANNAQNPTPAKAAQLKFDFGGMASFAAGSSAVNNANNNNADNTKADRRAVPKALWAAIPLTEQLSKRLGVKTFAALANHLAARIGGGGGVINRGVAVSGVNASSSSEKTIVVPQSAIVRSSSRNKTHEENNNVVAAIDAQIYDELLAKEKDIDLAAVGGVKRKGQSNNSGQEHNEGVVVEVPHTLASLPDPFATSCPTLLHMIPSAQRSGSFKGLINCLPLKHRAVIEEKRQTADTASNSGGGNNNSYGNAMMGGNNSGGGGGEKGGTDEMLTVIIAEMSRYFATLAKRATTWSEKLEAKKRRMKANETSVLSSDESNDFNPDAALFPEAFTSTTSKTEDGKDVIDGIVFTNLDEIKLDGAGSGSVNDKTNDEKAAAAEEEDGSEFDPLFFDDEAFAKLESKKKKGGEEKSASQQREEEEKVRKEELRQWAVTEASIRRVNAKLEELRTAIIGVKALQAYRGTEKIRAWVQPATGQMAKFLVAPPLLLPPQPVTTTSSSSLNSKAKASSLVVAPLPVLRPSFIHTGTATGRLLCRDPNLQNIPKGSTVAETFENVLRFGGRVLNEESGEEETAPTDNEEREAEKTARKKGGEEQGFSVRTLLSSRFIQPPTNLGKRSPSSSSSSSRRRGTLVEIDYSQLEPVAAAAITNDPALVEEIQQGVDQHCKRVALFLHKSYEEVYKLCKVLRIPEYVEHRQKMKVFSFQRQFGAGPRTISNTTGLSVQVIANLIEEEKKIYAGVEAFHKLVEECATPQASRAIESIRAGWMGPEKAAFIKKIEAPSNANGIFPLVCGTKFGFTKGAGTTRVKNHPTQGFATELVQTAVGMLFVHLVHRGMLDDVVLVNTVHDSVWLDCRCTQEDLRRRGGGEQQQQQGDANAHDNSASKPPIPVVLKEIEQILVSVLPIYRQTFNFENVNEDDDDASHAQTRYKQLLPSSSVSSSFFSAQPALASVELKVESAAGDSLASMEPIRF